MEIPCKDCITLSICKQQIQKIKVGKQNFYQGLSKVLNCKLAKEYLACDSEINPLREIIKYIYER